MAIIQPADNASLYSGSHGLLHRVVGVDSAASNNAVNIVADGSIINGKIRFTAEGGLAIKVTNKSGGNSTKGYLVTASTGTNNAVELAIINNPDIVGIFYESGIADGAECWVVVSGIADVYFMGSVTREWFARNLVTADSGTQGMAVGELVPSSPFSTDKHFQEIGHIIETRTGAGLAKCILHFN